MASHSSVFAWKIPWKEDPRGLSFMGCKESDTTEHMHTSACTHAHTHRVTLRYGVVNDGVYVFVKCKGKNIHTVTAVYIVGSQLPNIPACQLKSRTCH